MWRTQNGERTLQGAEARLIRAALQACVEFIEDDVTLRMEGDPWDFGVEQFDKLASNQKLALLAFVGEHLLCPTKTCPRLTAVNEAAIAVLYECIEQELQVELDNEGEWAVDDLERFGFRWRRLVLAAFEELPGDPGPDADRVDERCDDMSEWECILECLTDLVLWDRDFEDESRYVDKPPEQAQFLKDFMTIDDEYFNDIAPDPRASEMPAIRARLAELMRDAGEGS